MKCTLVRFELKKNLGQYESETLTAEVSADLEEDKTGDQLMGEARRICVQNSTAYLKAIKDKGGN